MTHQLWFDQISSSVSLDSTNIQQSVASILAVLKSCLAASLPDMIDLISISEGISSLLQKRKFQLLTYQSPMNCSICFSVTAMFVTYQFSNTCCEMVFQLIFVAVLIGSDVFPFPFVNRNVVIR